MAFVPISSFSFFAIKRSSPQFLTKRALGLPICYYPNGDIAPNDYACDLSIDVSHCCGVDAICLDNQMCRFSSGEDLRGSCTDQTYGSDVEVFKLSAVLYSSVTLSALLLVLLILFRFFLPCFPFTSSTPVLGYTTFYGVFIKLLMMCMSKQMLQPAAQTSYPAKMSQTAISISVVITPSTAVTRE